MIETLEKCRELEVKLSKAEEEKVLMGSKVRTPIFFSQCASGQYPANPAI